MEFRGIRRVNKPQSGLFSSHYYTAECRTYSAQFNSAAAAEPGRVVS